jgi:ribosomal protein S18 acetylase RimI-like enzyme
MAEIEIQLLQPRPSSEDLDQLANLLSATVHDGASVSFVVPFTEADAFDWWRGKVLPHAALGGRLILVARQDNRIVGSVQLLLDMPPNQQHRAEVAKLLVHPEARRQGIARALMLELDRLATHHRRSLITLDTVTGSSAEQLYRSLGYQLAGIIPNYARQALTPQLESTSIFFKLSIPPQCYKKISSWLQEFHRRRHGFGFSLSSRSPFRSLPKSHLTPSRYRRRPCRKQLRPQTCSAASTPRPARRAATKTSSSPLSTTTPRKSPMSGSA